MPGPGELPSQQPAPVIGRDAALARVRGLVDPVPQAGRVLLVTGEAGMGKTVLLADAADWARPTGMQVLRVTGRESESNLAFAGLHQLLRPVLSAAASLPGRQTQALQGALGLSAGPVAPDPLLIGVAVLTLLSDLSERSPVLVVADDAHWLDRSSLDALAFAASRLDAEPVVLLVCARGQAPPPGFDRGFPELHLGPLSAADAGRLLDVQPHPPRGQARAQVLAQAEGTADGLTAGGHSGLVGDSGGTPERVPGEGRLVTRRLFGDGNERGQRGGAPARPGQRPSGVAAGCQPQSGVRRDSEGPGGEILHPVPLAGGNSGRRGGDQPPGPAPWAGAEFRGAFHGLCGGGRAAAVLCLGGGGLEQRGHVLVRLQCCGGQVPGSAVWLVVQGLGELAVRCGPLRERRGVVDG